MSGPSSSGGCPGKRLDIGLDVQQMLPKNAAGGGLIRFARQLADHELDHVGIGDHVSFRDGRGFDGLMNAMALLASDGRLRVNLGVYLLPLRHASLVARQLSTLSEHAPGRLVFGCGIGGEDPNEFDACGVDPHTRGVRMNESLKVLRGLLMGQPFDFSGRFYQLSQASIVPAPPIRIPIIVAGKSEAAFARAAELGDGWIGVWMSAARVGAAIERVEALAAARGRVGVEWQHGLKLWCGFDHDGVAGHDRLAPIVEDFYKIPFSKFARYAPAGSPEQVADEVMTYLAAGVSTISIVAPGLPPDVAIAKAAEVRQIVRSRWPLIQ